MDGTISYSHNETRKLWQSKMTATQGQMLHDLPITDKAVDNDESAIPSNVRKFGGHVVSGEVTLFCFAVGLGSNTSIDQSAMPTRTSASSAAARSTGTTRDWLSTPITTRSRYKYASSTFTGRSNYVSGRNGNSQCDAVRPTDAAISTTPVPAGHWPSPMDNFHFVNHTYHVNWKKFLTFLQREGGASGTGTSRNLDDFF